MSIFKNCIIILVPSKLLKYGWGDFQCSHPGNIGVTAAVRHDTFMDFQFLPFLCPGIVKIILPPRVSYQRPRGVGKHPRQNRQQLVREDDFSLFALIGLDYRRNRYSISSLS